MSTSIVQRKIQTPQAKPTLKVLPKNDQRLLSNELNRRLSELYSFIDNTKKDINLHLKKMRNLQQLIGITEKCNNIILEQDHVCSEIKNLKKQVELFTKLNGVKDEMFYGQNPVNNYITSAIFNRNCNTISAQAKVSGGSIG